MGNYAAFLRGINVGGHNPVPMQGLKKVFESLRFKNVRILLASGNVVFEAVPRNTTTLEKKIEEKLKKTYGHEIGVPIRRIDELQQLSMSQPFKGIDVTPQTRLYITFLPEKNKSSLKIPYTSPDKCFKILRASESEVCSVVMLTPNSRTIDVMNILEKEFGRNVTTRNWNTIVRILKTQEN